MAECPCPPPSVGQPSFTELDVAYNNWKLIVEAREMELRLLRTDARKHIRKLDYAFGEVEMLDFFFGWGGSVWAFDLGAVGRRGGERGER